MSGVRAIVPARNSASTVGDAVRALRDVPEVDEVVVVDDGSTDTTTDVARAAGAWVLRLPRNLGKGGAVAAGVAATPETDVYLLVDADLGSTAAGCGALLGPVLAGKADMTIGILPPAGGRGGFGLVRDATGAGIRRACGFSGRAPMSGQRAVRGALLRSLTLGTRFGIEPAMTVDAVRAGARVQEVPIEVDHRHRGRGASGFAHRGRQGVDVARALWPRLTTGRARLALILGTALVALVSLLAVAERSPPGGSGAPLRAGKVLLVGVPGLDWADLGTGAVPTLDRLARTGSVGGLTVRTRSARPAVAEAYASLGAGTKVHADAAAAAVAPTGGNGRVVDAEALRAGAGRGVANRPGALGDALRDAGRRTAVVGNADVPPGLVNVRLDGQVRPTRFHPLAAALADGTGRVDVASVGTALLRDDPTAPFGVRADPDVVVDLARRALDGADVVLVDPGDLTRVASLSDEAAPASYRERALADLDSIVDRLVSDLPPSTLLVIVPVVPAGDSWRLVPVVVAGPAARQGNLFSPTTRKSGLATLSDIAPTVLEALGVDVPEAMVGEPLRSVVGRPDLSRPARLDEAERRREAMHVPVVAGYLVFQLVLYGVVAAEVRRRRPPPGPTVASSEGRGGGDRRGQEALRLALTAVVAFPLATFLLRGVALLFGERLTGAVTLVVIDLALVALTLLPSLARPARARPLAGPAWVLSATVAVLVVDAATGSNLHTASIMGHHPYVAGRFYGIGNAAFAVLGAGALLASAVHLEHAPRRSEALVSVAAFLTVVAVADGAPTVGNDVGGILTLVPVFGLTVVAFSRRRIGVALLGGAVAATLAALGLATVVDLVASPGDPSHLGRLAGEIADEGLGPLLTTVLRKLDVSLGILRGSRWTWLAPVTALAVLVLLARRRAAADVLPAGSSRRIGVWAVLALGVLGALVNDSGVVVTSLALSSLAAFVATAALADPPGRPVAGVLLEPALGPAGRGSEP